MSTAQIYSHGVPWEDAFSVAQGYSVNGTIYIAGQFSHDMQEPLLVSMILKRRFARHWITWIACSQDLT